MIKIDKGLPVPSLRKSDNGFDELLGDMRKLEIGDSFLWTRTSANWPRLVAKQLGFKISLWQQKIERYPDEANPTATYTWRIWRTK